jgi:Fic family protein
MICGDYMAIIDHKEWPNFTWDYLRIASQLPDLRFQQGRLLGFMESLSPALQNEATLTTLSQEIITSSEIAGESLHHELVCDALSNSSAVQGIVKVILDATFHYHTTLTEERLCDWHAALFPDGGYLQGPHLKYEMARFLKWLNAPSKTDLMIKSAVAHFWFLNIHPFAAGNGLIARAITALMLARVDKTSQRFYALSPQLLHERNTYQELFETCQQGTLDISIWIEWFLNCMKRTLITSKQTLQTVISKARFWELCRGETLNERQFKMINLLLDAGCEKLNSSVWANLTGCSQDSALRDITDLLKRNILVKADAGGRSTYYQLTNQVEVRS